MKRNADAVDGQQRPGDLRRLEVEFRRQQATPGRGRDEHGPERHVQYYQQSGHGQRGGRAAGPLVGGGDGNLNRHRRAGHGLVWSECVGGAAGDLGWFEQLLRSGNPVVERADVNQAVTASDGTSTYRNASIYYLYNPTTDGASHALGGTRGSGTVFWELKYLTLRGADTFTATVKNKSAFPLMVLSPVLAPPSAPADLTAIPTNLQIHLNWNPVNGATNYT